MGSLENGVPVKRPPLLRSSNSGSRSFFSRPRSRLARFLLFEKVDYLQWICTAATFFFVVILFQAFLPASVVERSGIRGRPPTAGERAAVGVFGEIGGLDFGDGIRFVPSKLLEKFEKERNEANLTSSKGMPGRRAGLVSPRLALVLGNLSPGATQLQMISIARALKEIGYDINVYALDDGPVYSIWTKAGFSLSILSSSNGRLLTSVDWLNYNGILISSLGAMPVMSCLSQEPFKSLPIIWTVHERSLALRLENYIASNKTQLINDWKQAFGRATVVVFPTQLLAMMYSLFDGGNYHVLPCSLLETWKANELSALIDGHNPRIKLGYKQEDFVLAIVGSQFSYSGSLLEHAIILHSIAPIMEEFSPSDLKIGILTENSIGLYTTTLEVLAIKFGFSNGSINLFTPNGNGSSFLGIADVVIYSSFLEEQFFPPVLVQAMSLRKLVVAPNLPMIKKYMGDGLNGYLFSQENAGMLNQILSQAISNGKLSDLSQKIAYMGEQLAKNLMASENIEGYAYLLENILKLPSEVSIPKFFTEVPLKLKEEWQWDLFDNILHSHYPNVSQENQSIVDRIEEKWNSTVMDNSGDKNRIENDTFFNIDWAEEKVNEMVIIRKRLLEEELKDRTEQSHGTWEEVYRSVKKAERVKNELHERDDRELERTGQPLCIYEPYFGEGAWPFLHHKSLYRGIGLSTKGRRRGVDDIDASSRLPILNSAYYRDALGEYGAFFALANRIDRIHKNAWIGFQSWRVKVQKAFLSKAAEHLLLEAIESGRHGDALYFWVRMDEDPRNPARHDFWTFCDTINAGNCRYAVTETLRRMYGMSLDWNSLPPMPTIGDSWSVMHSWALPTRSFLEFVMFSRMFVDALDAQIYEDHNQTGFCYLSLSKDRQCYSRVLELLVNVWAYHSARRIIYVNPQTGVMQEQHKLKNRRGHMWIKWFSYSTLKSMDEDLAEEMDSDHPNRRWLWPSTGEVFWHGIYERERNMRIHQKEMRKQQSRDKIRRIKKRARQKTLGKFIKPPPEELGDSNTTNVM